MFFKEFRYIVFYLGLGVLAGCTSPSGKIYQNEAYSWYPDRIEQGIYTARAISENHLESDYQSNERSYCSPLITFKFAINGEDNEMVSGMDHSFLCISEDQYAETPLIVFGVQHKESRKQDTDKKLPPDTRLKIRLDMRHVFDAFRKDGFFITQRGQKIFKEDFKDVYIAGNLNPMIWDFDNLVNSSDLRLEDENGDGIFEKELLLNPSNNITYSHKIWKRKNDISSYPIFETPFPLEKTLYNMALDEMVNAVEPDSTLRTGKEWAGVWTRDVSYSILLSMASLQTKVSKNSLMRKVNANRRIIQDTGTGGAWPVSSDRMIWAVAAWEVYKVTGERSWLEEVYPIIANSLEDDFLTVYDHKTGLVMGESSFIDWREQSYPRWMQSADIYKSKCLGTNALHYQSLKVAGKMALLLNDTLKFNYYESKAAKLKGAINKYLWMEDKGYYAQYMYGRNHDILSPRSETLGQALCVLFDVAGAGRQAQVVRSMPVQQYGAPIFYPHIEDIPPYHNKGIWPFVSSFWLHAASKVGNEQHIMHTIGSIYRAAALFTTNKENFVAESGDYKGTQINSDNMLWSLSGCLSIVYKTYFGINMSQDGILFHPVIPQSISGIRSLKNYRYRNATFDITVEGYGNKIGSFTLDGNEQDPFIPGDIRGTHKIYIRLANNEFLENEINLLPSENAPLTPRVRRTGSGFKWDSLPNAVRYQVLINGEVLAETAECFFPKDDLPQGEFQVIALNQKDIPSFSSEPVLIRLDDVILFEVEEYAIKSDLNYEGASGSGFSEISKEMNRVIQIPITVAHAGCYALDWRYANGNGPVNTENKCAIRTLLVNKNFVGVSIFPHRGKDDWTEWGWSNSTEVTLNKGVNLITLEYRPSNENMNLLVNQAMLDQMRLVRLE